MFWLDGSSALPLEAISPHFAGKAWVEELLKDFAQVENQAKIAKSWVEIGNFDHWCNAASELVDLTIMLYDMDLSFCYYEGYLSENERNCQLADLKSQFVNSVCFSTFEHARERLFGESRLSTSSSITTTATSSPHRDSLDSGSSVTSAETNRGDAVTIESPALPPLESPTAGLTLITTSTSTSGNIDSAPNGSNPNAPACAHTVVTQMPRHGLLPPHFTTTTSRVGPQHGSLDPTGANDVTPTSPPMPRRQLALTPLTSSLISCNRESRSNDRLPAFTRSGMEMEMEMEMERVERREKKVGIEMLKGVKLDWDAEMRVLDGRRDESTKARATSKPTTPPSTSNHERGQENGNERRKRRRRRRRRHRCQPLANAPVGLGPPNPLPYPSKHPSLLPLSRLPTPTRLGDTLRCDKRHRHGRHHRRRATVDTAGMLLPTSLVPGQHPPLPQIPDDGDTARRRERQRHRCRTTSIDASLPTPTPAPAPVAASTPDYAPAPSFCQQPRQPCANPLLSTTPPCIFFFFWGGEGPGL
jgi:hypothetical protein